VFGYQQGGERAHTQVRGRCQALSARDRQDPRRRLVWRRLLTIGAAALLFAFLAVSSVLFVWPASNRPGHVDAIVSLNGTDEPARESTAIMLAQRGYAPVLLFSQGNYRTTPCPQVPRVVVVCFEPKPARTVGEVEFAANYARVRGWHSLLIVPGRAQATRARLLMDRCFRGQVLIVPAAVPLLRLPIDVIYEWGALAKALLVDRSC
jgi:uncharacterized SAM-binding protein YcdF (DUF218 family)